MIENKKYRDLINSLKALGGVTVAFSGGVDSTFLVRAAKEALGDKVMAVTIVSPYIPKWEVDEAKELVESLGIKHKLLVVEKIPSEIKFNPEDRCYLCKTAIFTKVKAMAEEEGLSCVIDGTNADDTKDYRPGMKALKELRIISPLLENGITKKEIRDFSRELRLPTWDKPAYACLLSRIPYGEEIKQEELKRIESSEKYLIGLGFRAVRVRKHGDLARIEVPKESIERIFKEELLEQIAKQLKGYGFKYVTLDMEGYKMGSLNQGIVK